MDFVMPSRRCDNRDDRQAEFQRKSKIAFIVTGHGHDCTSTVSHQNIIRDPDRNAGLIHRIDGISASKNTRLFLISCLALNIRLTGSCLAVCFNLSFLLRRGDLLAPVGVPVQEP